MAMMVAEVEALAVSGVSGGGGGGGDGGQLVAAANNVSNDISCMK